MELIEMKYYDNKNNNYKRLSKIIENIDKSEDDILKQKLKNDVLKTINEIKSYYVQIIIPPFKNLKNKKYLK
jgi:hypothetical protein